ncbi:P-TEFB associated cyclin, partial [Paramicrosporidium saccamoebae]
RDGGNYPCGMAKAQATGEAQWILSADEYSSLAAFKRSTDEEETTQRYKATGLVQSLGMRLKLPQTTIATAQVFLHRFYIRETFKAFPSAELAPAVVFLASKVEEHPRKLKDVLHDSPLSPERVLQLEKIILQTVCFDLTVTHPYRFVFRIVKGLRDVPDELVQSAWIVVNDSYRTTLCIRVPSKSVAAGAFCYAAEKKGLDVASLAADAVTDQLILDCPRAEVQGS